MEAKYIKIAMILENSRSRNDRRKKVCKVVGEYRTIEGIEYRRGYEFPNGTDIHTLKLPDSIIVN